MEEIILNCLKRRTSMGEERGNQDNKRQWRVREEGEGVKRRREEGGRM
jgi:hypothetical protein